MHRFWLLAFAAAFAVGCASDPSNGNGSASTRDDDTLEESSNANGIGGAHWDDVERPLRARYDYVMIPGEPGPPNPATGEDTPAELNVIPLFRFRADTAGDPPRPVKAVVILQAGFVAGANQMFHIARSLVEMSGGELEVWVPEKRHTLLEDQYGMDLAEAERDPYIAYRYYVEGEEIDGHVYSSPDLHGPETDMMSEWGLDLWMKDMRRLVELVPEEHRPTKVFIAGDSRGVAFTQAFAAYEFDDGALGSDLVAGLILWDGGLRADPSLNESTYAERLDDIRSGVSPRTVGMDEETTWFMEIFGMACTPGMGDPEDPTRGPDGFFPDYGAFAALLPWLTRFRNPTLTNEAFFGLVMDSDYLPYPKFMGHMGRLTGGELRRDIFGEYPADSHATYSWLRYDECEPREIVDIRKLTKMLWEGPSNFTDLWYSSRLDLDLHAALPFESEGTWVEDWFRLRTSEVDAPVFAMISLNYYGEGLMEAYRDRLAPVRGFDVPRDEYGFVLIEKPEWSHLDAIAVERELNPLYPQLLRWIDRWSDGEVEIPAF